MEKSSLTDINCPTDGDLAAEKPKTKKKENTPYEVKTNKKGIKKKKDDEIVPDNKINKSSHSVCIADEYPIHDDSEDSVVLVSDLSTLDETLTEHSNEKATENNRFPEKQASESNAETKSDSETDNSEMDSHQKISSNEDKTEELVTEVNRHEESITYKETSNDHSQESIGHEKSDQCNKEQLKQEDAVFIKPCNSKLLAKKKAMKCKEMMNLLKETIGTDMKIGKGSKNHKHKHKHKDKTGQEMENKVNRLKEIVSEKRKGRKKVKFSESVHNEVKAEGKSKETVSELTENDSKDKTNSETAGDGCPNEPSECKSEEKDPEMNSGTRSYTNNKNLVDKQDDKQDSENHNVENKKKQYKKLQKTKRTDNDSIMSKKRTSHKTDKAANTRENKEDCDTKTENNTSETKSISYEDFLKSLEKEPSGILDEPAPLEVKGDTKTEKSNSELIEDSIQSISEDMDVEVMESGTDEPEKVLEENSETLQEAEMSVTKPSDITERSKVCHTPKVKKKQNENEKSESLAETKSGGIARFFTVLTSTPDKPKTDAERKNIQQQISLPSNKNPKKNKKCNKLEKVANDSSNINMEKKPEENSVLKEQKDGNISGSDSIEIVEDTVEDGSKIEKDAGTQKRKHEFLNSRSSVNSCKTTQAVLSFGTTGLTMAKCENVDVNAGDEDHTDDNTNVKSQKTKVKKGSKPAVKSKQKQNLSDDSNVFETPKAKSKGRKSKSKDKAHIQPSESEESYDHSQTDDSEDSTRRRSLRSRYKVAMFEMDEEKRIPIKLKLKR